jgi:hypothetical protein
MLSGRVVLRSLGKGGVKRTERDGFEKGLLGR